MILAAFETSADWCSVAISLDGEIGALEQRAGQRQAELAPPMLGRLLAEAGISAARLDAVAFGSGPGSFTGLRIACGLAQGIAFARDLPVIGISTLAAMAEECGGPRVVACLDARMREVYYACLERDGTSWREVVGARCVAPQSVPAPAGTGWIGCGSGFSAYPELLGHLAQKVLPEVHASALAVARLAAPRLAAGEGLDPAHAAPVYLRDKVAFTTQERERAALPERS
jgi:tRNA threonylcarbamoyladenosine biosynthesis protein TsaB